MSFNKTFTNFVRLIQGKFFKEIPEIDPTLKASFARASTTSTAAASVSLQEGIKDAVKQSFPQTADDEFLELIGSYDNIERFPATPSDGNVSVEGVMSTTVPSGTELTYQGNSYLTTQDSTVQEYTGDVALSFSAGIVTAVTSVVHTLASGIETTISGAVQTDYNGTFDITVIDENTFTYSVDAGSLTTDSGQYSADYALLSIESSDSGDDQNIDSGAGMQIDVTDINSTAYVGANGIADGFDEESIEDFRERVLENHDFTPGISTPPGIKFSAKQIAGNTRVFIIRPTGVSGGIQGEVGYRPELGETVVYILRDDDPSIQPSSEKLTETKDKILADGNWPTFIQDEFLYVLAPDLQEEDFVFTSITPNTTTMQNAIREQLISFFQDNAEIEGTISLEETLNPFLRTITDSTTGELLTGFSYSSPASDMTTDSGKISTRGSVTFV